VLEIIDRSPGLSDYKEGKVLVNHNEKQRVTLKMTRGKVNRGDENDLVAAMFGGGGFGFGFGFGGGDQEEDEEQDEITKQAATTEENKEQEEQEIELAWSELIEPKIILASSSSALAAHVGAGSTGGKHK